ncbi:MAG: ATP-binding protein [Candidatus Zixiibacteriota bacterium]
MPVFDGERVVAVAAVANKAEPYLTSDINAMTSLLNKLWIIMRRKESEEAVRRLNTDLLRHSNALQAVNMELEAFSYSVSHDLRAPLRAIGGFSQILLEDHVAKLDEDGKGCLGRISRAANDMGILIDDMLALSRVTRKELAREAVDLSAIVAKKADDLHKLHPEREVEFVIADGMRVNGDSSLMSIALENLLHNAWKYTSRHRTAKIEVGTEVIDGQTVFFVRDDGAGFDMKYAEKLFKPFQRLHAADEFEGSGVGLATVQRVISRHGGRVWATGAVEKGATFYFTCEQPQEVFVHA